MINNIVCPECFNSWDQDGKFDTICKDCGYDCYDQSSEHIVDDEPEDISDSYAGDDL